MDLERVKTITIAHLDFEDLIARRTGNPLAEDQVPQMLRDAINKGVEVILTDSLGQKACKLILSQDGSFQYAPVA